MALGSDEIENRFGFHKATIEGANATTELHRDLRLAYKRFAAVLDEVLADGRNKDKAMEHLEEASMWSHKSIAEKAPVVNE